METECMKTVYFENALNLSVEELTEACKIKTKLMEIIEKEAVISEVRVGFKFLEVEFYDFPEKRTIRVEEDGSTSLRTSIGFVMVSKEIGDVIIKSIKEKQKKNEFINVKLLPL